MLLQRAKARCYCYLHQQQVQHTEISPFLPEVEVKTCRTLMAVPWVPQVKAQNQQTQVCFISKCQHLAFCGCQSMGTTVWLSDCRYGMVTRQSLRQGKQRQNLSLDETSTDTYTHIHTHTKTNIHSCELKFCTKPHTFSCLKFLHLRGHLFDSWLHVHI